MPRISPLLLLRLAILVALAGAAALAVDYASIESAFCGAGSGCAELRRSELAYLWGLGVSLPQVGLLAFAAVYALSLTRAARVAAQLSILAGVLALGLIGFQARAGHFCWLCMTVDCAAIVAGAAGAWGLASPASMQQRTPLNSFGWMGLGVVFMLAPALWPSLRPAPPVPSNIRALYTPGKINVVEFADFECPYCRQLHHRLRALLAPYGDRVRFLRLNMPLASHPYAHDAALASLCVGQSGQSPAAAPQPGQSGQSPAAAPQQQPNPRHAEFIEFLFSTEDLSVPALRKEAERLGVAPAEFDRCLHAPETAARVEREAAILREAGLVGLPTTYIGGRRVVGAQPDDVFRDALSRAEHGADDRGVPGWAYCAFVLAALAAVIVMGRSRAAEQAR